MKRSGGQKIQPRRLYNKISWRSFSSFNFPETWHYSSYGLDRLPGLVLLADEPDSDSDRCRGPARSLDTILPPPCHIPLRFFFHPTFFPSSWTQWVWKDFAPHSSNLNSVSLCMSFSYSLSLTVRTRPTRRDPHLPGSPNRRSLSTRYHNHSVISVQICQ